MKNVLEMEFLYNKLDLLFNRKIIALVKYKYYKKYFTTKIQRKDYRYVLCQHCNNTQKTGIELE